MNFTDAKLLASALGFIRIADIRGRTDIEEIFGDLTLKSHPTRLIGIYLQIREDDRLYIGKTVNLPQRTQKHRDDGVLINFLAFRPVDKKTISSAEEKCILKARSMGLELQNIQINRDKDNSPDYLFDDFMPADSQDEHIRKVIEGRSFAGQWMRLYGEATPVERHDWERFWKTTYQPVTQLYAARLFIDTTIPEPGECLGRYLRCNLPAQRHDPLHNCLVLTAGVYGVFKIFYYVRAPEQLFCGIDLDPGILYRTFGSKEAVLDALVWAKLTLPDPEPERNVEELLAQTNFHRREPTFLGPTDKAAYLSRHLTHVNVANLAHAVFPIGLIDSAMSDRVFSTAAALAAVAAMRFRKPIQNDHNRLLALKLCPDILNG